MKPESYITAREAQTLTKTYSPASIFVLINAEAEKGLRYLALTGRAVDATTRQMLTEAGYRLRIGGLDNEVLIIEW